MAWNRPVNHSVHAPVRALVLAGGGARGSYQVGVWRALTELGWRPGIITGTSVGSLNGAMFALDLYETARDMWLTIRSQDVMELPEQNADLSELHAFLRDVVRQGGMDVNNSKLAQFSKKYAGATEFYVEMQEVDYGEDGSAARSIDGRAARKGENCYVSMTTSGKNQKQQLIETLMLKNNSTWDQYLLFRSSKAAVKSRSEDDVDLSLGALIASKLPTQMWSTEIKVGPTKYYAEVYKYYPYEYTTCFTADGKPVYQFVRDLREKQLESATLYKTIQAGSGTSKGLCALPTGTKTYSFDDNTGSLTDAKGNMFTLKEDGTTGIKVYDKAGKDVTNDFKWLTDFFKMMSGE